jgi:uncharacterized protein (DUF1697 family)
MHTYIALLYSIIGGSGCRITKADLLEVAAGCGFGGARTAMSTGNLIFQSSNADIASLERTLETSIAKRCEKHIDVIVRSGDAWRDLMAGNPFSDEAKRNPANLAVRVMRHHYDPEFPQVLANRVEGEVMEVVNGDLWVWFPQGTASSRLLSAFRKPSSRSVGTWRNWNTLCKIDILRKQDP